MARLGTIDCVTMNWPITPAASSVETFTHPTVAGVGVLYGPARQVPQRLTCTVFAIDRANASQIQAAIADLANGALIAIDPDGDGLGDSNIPDCRITSRPITSAKACAGLPDGYGWLVTAEMDAMPPLDWPS
jgi:hypothetical protein